METPCARRLRTVATHVGDGVTAVANVSAGSTAKAKGRMNISPLQGKVPGPFSEMDLAFWADNGYVVLRDAVPSANLQAVKDDMFSFLGWDPTEPDGWYADPPPQATDGSNKTNPGGMVEMYNTQSLWDNRMNPRVYQAFAQIWGVEQLWVSNDRACLKAPARVGTAWDGDGFIHWDADVRDGKVDFKVQGVLFLADTPEGGGGFQCIPGFVNEFESWHQSLGLENLAEDDPGTAWHKSPRMRKIYSEMQKVHKARGKEIAGRAGDLLLWHTHLPHGNCRNSSDQPRLAQYITMAPAPTAPERQAFPGLFDWGSSQQRIDTFMGKLKSDAEWEEKPDAIAAADAGSRVEPPAVLTQLGRRLLGAEPW